MSLRSTFRTIRAVFVIATLFVGSVVAHDSAYADEPTLEGLARADQLYREGNDAFDAGNLQQAYKKYRAAFAIKKSYDIAGNLGAVELELHKPAAAAEHLEYSLRRYPANNPKGRKATADRLELAKKQIAIVVVKVNVADATITLDGEPLSNSRAFVSVGPHQLVAKHPDYRDASRSLDLRAGSEHRIEMRLEAKDVPVVPPPAELPVWPIAIGGAATAVSLGLGIAFRVVGDGQEDDGDGLRDDIAAAGGQCPNGARCAEVADPYADARSNHDLSVGLFVGAGAAAVATVIYAVVVLTAESDAPEAATALPQVQPLVGPTFAGVGLHLHF